MEPLEAAHEFLKQLHRLGVADKFAALPTVHQREYFKWINEAKEPAARVARYEILRSKLLGH